MPYKNKSDQAACARRHYDLNKQEIKARARTWTTNQIRLSRKLISEHFATHPCVDCGESDRIVLDFDHVRGKKQANVADLVKAGCSWSRISAEIEKCDVRCANCHRRVTHKRRFL